VRDPTIARNYAEALFALGERIGRSGELADLMVGLATAMETDPRVRAALESPRVPRGKKVAVLEGAFSAVAPPEFVRFLAAVVKRGRQYLLPIIATEYVALVDEAAGRVRVGVTLAREPDEALQATVKEQLGKVLGKEVVPTYRTDPSILGGLILRVGDRIVDGSLRRRLARLRRQLLAH